jgi:hypothetical protein
MYIFKCSYEELEEILVDSEEYKNNTHTHEILMSDREYFLFLKLLRTEDDYMIKHCEKWRE